MKPISLQLVLALLAFISPAAAESYSLRQCPNFAATEQPYLYLYTGEEYQGDPLYITNASVGNLGSLRIGRSYLSFFNDKASSMRVRGKWRICTKSLYGGQCVDVQSGDWKSEMMVASLTERFGPEFEDSVSSVKLLACSQY